MRSMRASGEKITRTITLGAAPLQPFVNLGENLLRGKALATGERRAWKSLKPHFFPSNASSSPISRSITLKPPCQNFGSRASSPNGLSNSE
jgi:hypothetical protein